MWHAGGEPSSMRRVVGYGAVVEGLVRPQPERLQRADATKTMTHEGCAHPSLATRVWQVCYPQQRSGRKAAEYTSDESAPNHTIDNGKNENKIESNANEYLKP